MGLALCLFAYAWIAFKAKVLKDQIDGPGELRITAILVAALCFNLYTLSPMSDLDDIRIGDWLVIHNPMFRNSDGCALAWTNQRQFWLQGPGRK